MVAAYDTKNLTRRIALIGCMLAAHCAIASGATQAVIGLSSTDSLEQQVNAAMGLRDSTIFKLAVDPTPGQPLVLMVPLDGGYYQVDLMPHSVRAPGYQVLVEVEGGALEPAEPAPVRTLRGEIVDLPGSVVAGATFDDGLRARLVLPDGRNLWLEPAAAHVPGAAFDDYVLYDSADVVNCTGVCGVTESHGADEHGLADGPGGGPTTGGLCVTELACDADVEYFNRWGSVQNVQNQINAVIASMNVQYERDLQITHVITTIIVRTQEPDPYSSSDPGTLLNQFRGYWLANHGNIQRDVAELFTGKDMSGGVIGIAFLGGVCNTNGFNVVQSDFTGSFACKTDLSAHELGHNWNADHCSCPGYTMNPSITCANRFHPTFDIPEMTTFRNSRTCLDCDPGNPVKAVLESLNVNVGTLISGGLAELDQSDDARVEASPALVQGLYRTNAIIVARGPQGPVTRLDLKVELSSVPVGTKVGVFLRNVNTQTWDLIERYDSTTSDTVKIWAPVALPNNYVKQNTGAIRVRIFMRNLDGNTFTSRYDHVELMVTP